MAAFFCLIGLLACFYAVISLCLIILKGLRQFVFVTRLDPKKYGEYSVVTGATSGIGYAFAEELAKRGSNLIILGRKADVLENIKKDFEMKYKIAVVTIIKDFVEQDYTDVKEKLEGFDIGILVNNAGVSTNVGTGYQDIDEKKLVEIVNTNMLSYIMMTRIILPELLQKKKGIVVNIGSLAQNYPLPFWGVYPQSKMFVNYFTRSLQNELPFHKSGVYFNTINPGPVATKLSKIPPSWCVPSPERYIASAMDSFEYNGESSGFWLHFIMDVTFRLIPTSLMDAFFLLFPVSKILPRKRSKVQ